ncbi:MAG TPA: efflux RND transporter periplasmic adaptor subunit [Bacteroidales bacterium]|jgi:RND family efflux transporter MFP subunit|nr:efflux RND transporter periplasmic adaptor subunit [Bacteroidales bacterium]HQH22909.1 efflux RND transporter periplasmic adaptor subunit [Bacteroidales bacterium]HQJ81970.1 efflux RND transporter periplasmic adaptor subunit [Bacteroidales bacterium]
MKYLKTIPLVMTAVLIFSGCSAKKSDKAPGNVSGERAVIPVRVLALERTKIARTIDYTATIMPYEEVNMAPSTPGRIDRIYVETGDRVTKGQELFLMDRTQLYQQRVQLSSVQKDLSRLDTLLRTGSATQQQYDQMKTQYDVLKTNVDFMEENTLLRAPFNGVITGKYFENGEMYSGTPTTQSGRSAIVTIMQVNPLKVNVSVSEQYYPLIINGMKASVTADVYPGEVFTGRVFRKAPTVNPVTRSFIAEIELPNRNDMLKPGMFVRVSMDMGEVATFVVPAAAVLLQEGTNIRYVFIEENGIARRLEVVLGKRFDDQLEIISDNLSEGDHLVTDGQSKLMNNDRIEVVI